MDNFKNAHCIKRCMKALLIFLFLFNLILQAQSDWERWEAVELPYRISGNEPGGISFDDSNVGTLLLSSAKNAYSFFISDLDGDNCPFHPSCSNFFVQGVKETNILQGILMFADRFTRDSNFLKGRTNYSLHISGKLFDPVSNYKLDSQSVSYNPHYLLIK